jgi:cytochrome c553
MKTKNQQSAPRAAKVLTGLALVMAASLVFAEDPAPAPATDATIAKSIADERGHERPLQPATKLATKLAPERAQHLAVVWCSACHGGGGRSVAPTFPILAGQSAEYLVTELREFHFLSQDDRADTHESMFEQWIINITGLRRNYRYEDAPRNEPRAWDFMKGVARDLDEPTMEALADYYAKQTPAAGRVTGGGDLAHGKTLFDEGDANKGLLACQMCHGPDAKGQGPIPRLAGQHADYVKLQLKFIQSGLRNVEQMQALIANLDDKDFADLAAYVQSLN